MKISGKVVGVHGKFRFELTVTGIPHDLTEAENAGAGGFCLLCQIHYGYIGYLLRVFEDDVRDHFFLVVQRVVTVLYLNDWISLHVFRNIPPCRMFLFISSILSYRQPDEKLNLILHIPYESVIEIISAEK